MTQEQKELLLKDLCARLPYGVNCKIYHKYRYYDMKLSGVFDNEAYFTDDNGSLYIDYENIKQYLFPLSSITEEQKNSFPFSYSFLEALIDGGVYFDEDECITLNDMIYVIQWCYKNHFDIHGLIPMGLAIDATDKNIY